jgi:lysophospholipase L1-like esterase
MAGTVRLGCKHSRWSVAVATGLISSLTMAPPAWAASINIVAIGASTTAGKRVGVEGAYPAQLEAMLKSKGYDVNIRNAGVSGATSDSMVGWADAVPSDTRLVLLQIAHSNDGKQYHRLKRQQTVALSSDISRRDILG